MSLAEPVIPCLIQLVCIRTILQTIGHSCSPIARWRCECRPSSSQPRPAGRSRRLLRLLLSRRRTRLVLLAPAPPSMTDSAPVPLRDETVPAGSSPRIAMGPAESFPPSSSILLAPAPFLRLVSGSGAMSADPTSAVARREQRLQAGDRARPRIIRSYLVSPPTNDIATFEYGAQSCPIRFPPPEGGIESHAMLSSLDLFFQYYRKGHSSHTQRRSALSGGSISGGRKCTKGTRSPPPHPPFWQSLGPAVSAENFRALRRCRMWTQGAKLQSQTRVERAGDPTRHRRNVMIWYFGIVLIERIC